MGRKERLELIKKIETKRDSKVITYITGDRYGMQTAISTDIFPMFHKHLMQIGKQKRIDLFIYSTGGITIAGYALVNLIREFCDEFNVIIPFKALSCATLISLGANKIIMTPMGQLSPIDPSITHPLGPKVQNQMQQIQIVPVNVEDVNAFVDLATKETNLKEEESLRKVFELLGNTVHPLVLGAVQRSRAQIAFLAKQLMSRHISDEDVIKKVVQMLTRELFSHDYVIGRREARETLKLPIEEPGQDDLGIYVKLFDEYSDLMKLTDPYNPEKTLGSKGEGEYQFYQAAIESTHLTHVYKTSKFLRKISIQKPVGEGVTIPVSAHEERILHQGWVQDEMV